MNKLIVTLDNYKSLSTKELEKWFRENVNASFNRFSDRKTAERRVHDVLKTEAPKAEAKHPAHPAKVEKDAPKAKKEKAPKEPKAPREKVAKEPGERRSNSAGIAESWNDKRVRAERLTRHQVIVTHKDKDGKRVVNDYNSVHAAFVALRLPVEKVIRFRMGLKKEGTATFEARGVEFKFALAE